MTESATQTQTQTQDGTQTQSTTGGDTNGNDQVSQSPKVMELLSPELRENKLLERFKDKDVDTVVKSWIEAQGVINRKGLTLPNENDSPEAWGNFYNSIGRPENVEGYELAKPEKLPEGMTYDEDRTKAFAAKAHELGITKKQLQGMHSLWNELATADYEKQTQAAEEFFSNSTAEIKKEWGGDYESNLKKADAAIVTLFGENFRKMLVDTGLNNHPDIIRGMFKASQAIGEHAFDNGGGGTTKTKVTYEEILSAKNDPRYYDPGRRDPAYVRKVDQMVKDYTASMGA